MRTMTKTIGALGLAAALVLTSFTGVSAAKKEKKSQPDTTVTVEALKAKATCTAAGKINVSFSTAVEWSEVKMHRHYLLMNSRMKSRCRLLKKQTAQLS